MPQQHSDNHGCAQSDVDRAAAIIRDGGVVAFPTETVYGLGADALNAQAAARVFEIKRRPRFDPLIIHVDSIDRARSLVTEWPEWASSLVGRFWPGPLTIVLPKETYVPDIVTAGLPTVAMRMPDHPLAMELIRSADAPIAAPSANRFGSVSPTTAGHVRVSLGEEVDLILDGGPCRAGVESTIISLIDDQPKLLRPGAAPLEEIEQVLGPVRLAADAERMPNAPEAPGMLARHYATAKTLVLVDAFDEDSIRAAIGERSGHSCGVLCLGSQFGRINVDDTAIVTEVLSESDDLREAAANLFAAMRRLDAMESIQWILACRVPDRGLGLAINDRLSRASHARD